MTGLIIRRLIQMPLILMVIYTITFTLAAKDGSLGPAALIAVFQGRNMRTPVVRLGL